MINRDLEQKLHDTVEENRDLQEELAETNQGIIALTIELQQAEEKYRSILETAESAIVTFSENGIIETFNPSFKRLFGFGENEIVERNIDSFLINPENKENKSIFREYLFQKGLTISNGQLEREALGLRRDGTLFPIDFSVGEVVINDKKIFTLILRDITERKKAEEKLKQYASMCINNPAPVFQMYSDSGKIVGDTNPAFKKVFKFVDKNKSIYEQIPAFKEIVNKMEGNDTTQLEYSIEAKIYLFTINSWHSNLIDVYGDDITEHKRMDEEIHHKSELIQLMQKITITANEASTVDEAMQTCLDSICPYLGWPIGHVYFLETTGKLIPSKLWHLDSPEQFKTFRIITEKTSFDKGVGLPGRVLASGKPAWITDVTKDPNFPRSKLAKEINIKAGFAFPVLEDKKVVAVLEFFDKEAIEPDRSLLDSISILAAQLGRVTERKRAEKERQEMEIKMLASSKLATLGEVSTGVAHEINQPLTYISSLIQTLKLDIKEHSIDEPELTEDLNFASRQVERIVSIINHLRTFGRQYDVSREEIDLKSILDNTLLLLSERIRLRNIKLVCDVEEKLSMAWGNANQLEQVFINLFQNAIDALHKKKENAEIKVDISLHAEKEAIQIKFSDNGAGMEEATREKIFEPFFTTKKVGKGTGLGLSIVYGIIQEHGGEVTCESRINKGTAFTILIPLRKSKRGSRGK